MTTGTNYKAELHAARQMLAASKRKVVEHRQRVKELAAAARDYAKTVRLDKAEARAKAKEERKLTKIVKEDLRATKAAARDQKRTERIAKMEARLNKLKLTAGRKHSKPVVYTAEQIAAINAA